MVDNTQIKDGMGNVFTLRTRDVSLSQDGTLRRAMTLATAHPVDYGTAGCYQLNSKGGTMAASGAFTVQPIYSFRWTSSAILVLFRRMRLQAWSLGTGFTAGIATFDIMMARSFTAADTGGTTDTITSQNCKLRTSMGSSSVAEIRHSTTTQLTGGTRTMDAQPIDSWSVTVGTSAFTAFMPTPHKIFERLQGEHPIVLAQNEGIIINATVPATGTWSFSITAEWDEVKTF